MTREHVERRSTSQASRAATNRAIVIELERLATMYPRADMDERKWALLFETYCQDLEGRTIEQIRIACQRYRQNPENHYRFPTSGQLLELCPTRFDSAPMGGRPGRMTAKDGWQPWGGDCQCERCRNKTPREGFYKAPKEFSERQNAERKTARALCAR